MSDFSANLQFAPCMHRHVVSVSIGSRRFSQGEVVDDIQERLQCLDCLEYVSELEVRAAWSGQSLEEELASHLGDDFEQEDVPIREEVKE